jgi:hypothetical protein
MRHLWITAALVIAACAGEEGSWYDTGGKNIGKPQWARIDPSASRLRLPRAFRPIREVISGSLPGRSFESVEFATGYVDLEEAPGRAYADEIPASRFRAIFDGAVVLEMSVESSRLKPRREFPTTYAEFTLGEHPCLAFRRPIGPPLPVPSRHEGIVSGIYCDTTGGGNFKKRALGYVRQIRLRQPGEVLDEPGEPPDGPPLKPAAEVRAYLDRNRHDIRNALSAYNREHRALVGNDDALDVKEVVSMTLQDLKGDRVYVETSFTVGADGSNRIAGADTLLFELRWVEGELAFVGHDSL